MPLDVRSGALASVLVAAIERKFAFTATTLIVGGSYAVGNADAQSDLDVVVVEPGAARRYFVRLPELELDVDFTVSSQTYFLESLRLQMAPGSPQFGLVVLLARGLVLLDGAGGGEQIVELATDVMERGFDAIPPELGFSIRHRAWTMVNATSRDGYDDAGYHFVCTWALSYLIEVYCILNGLWLSGNGKMQAKRLPVVAPALWDLVRRFHAAHGRNERSERLEAIADFVLAPFGGGTQRYGGHG